MIPIRFAYLIAYFVRHDDAETPPTGASKERRERAQKKDRGEVTRKIAAGGRVATAGWPRRALLCSWRTAAALTVVLS